MLGLLFSLLLSSQTASTLEVGYVVERPSPGGWTASGPRGSRRLDLGSGVFPGDTVVAPASASPGSAIAIVLFSTGRVVRIASGGEVDDRQPPRAGTLERLWGAIRRRLNNETLRSGLVRSGNVLSDGVLSLNDERGWQTLAPSIAIADFTARMRRLGQDGEPTGEWTESQPMAAVRFSSPGLWQVSVRHRRLPSVSGDAWVLVTKDAGSARIYEQFSTGLTASLETESADLASTAATLRRAALLSLATDAR